MGKKEIRNAESFDKVNSFAFFFKIGLEASTNNCKIHLL